MTGIMGIICNGLFIKQAWFSCSSENITQEEPERDDGICYQG